MRLFRHVFHDRKTFGHSSSHHHIDRCPDCHNIKIQMRSAKFLRLCDNLAVFNIDVRTKSPKSFQMLIDRSASDIASSRQRNFRSFIFPEKSSQQIVRRSDLLNVIILYIKIADRTSVDLYCMTIDPLHHRADSLDRFQHHIHIIHIRKIIDLNSLIRHDCSRQNCKRRIFRAADLHFSDKRIPAFYDILFHITPLFRFYYHTCTFPYVFSISLFYLIFFIISFQSAVFILPHIRPF